MEYIYYILYLQGQSIINQKNNWLLLQIYIISLKIYFLCDCKIIKQLWFSLSLFLFLQSQSLYSVNDSNKHAIYTISCGDLRQVTRWSDSSYSSKISKVTPRFNRDCQMNWYILFYGLSVIIRCQWTLCHTMRHFPYSNCIAVILLKV